MKIFISTINSHDSCTDGKNIINEMHLKTTAGRLYINSLLWLDILKHFKMTNIITSKCFLEVCRFGNKFIAIPIPTTSCSTIRTFPYTYDGLIGVEKWSPSVVGEEYDIISIIPPSKLPILPFIRVYNCHPYLNGIPCRQGPSWVGNHYVESTFIGLSIITEQTEQHLINPISTEGESSHGDLNKNAIHRLSLHLLSDFNDKHPIHLRGPKGSGKTETYLSTCRKLNIAPLLYSPDHSLKTFISSLTNLKNNSHILFDNSDLLGEDELSLLKILIKMNIFNITIISQNLKDCFLGDVIELSIKEKENRKEITTTITDSWDKLGGISSVKKRIEEAIIWPLMHSKELLLMGIRKPKGILMHGPPGCSKTTIARLIASGVGNFTFLPVSGASLYSCWVGESERSLRALFERGRQESPSLIFIDEIDALVGNRSSGGGSSGGSDQVQERILSTLLNEMDGIDDCNGDVLVLAATNRLDKIDSALKRPGRFDIILEIPLPDFVGRIEIIKAITCFRGDGNESTDGMYGKILLEGGIHDWEATFNDIAHCTDGWSGALLKNLFQEAAMASIKDDLPSISISLIKSLL